MVRVINGSKITTEEINLIRYILSERMKYDYHEFNPDNNFIPFIDKNNIKGDTIILGDNWFLTYSVEDNNLFINNFFAMPGSLNGRLAEIFNTINEMLYKYQGFYVISSLRHDTSYKLYSFLLKRGIITEISNNFSFRTGNSSIDESLRREYNISSSSVEFKYLKFLYHQIICMIGDVREKIPELQEKQKYYQYLSKTKQRVRL